MAVGLTEIVQNIVNGLLQGGFLALASVGLSLIYGVQKILNIAHGAFIVIAAFVTIDFSIFLSPVLHLDPLISIILDFGVLTVFGVLTYFGLIFKTENKGFEGPLLATFGLSAGRPATASRTAASEPFQTHDRLVNMIALFA